MGGNHSDLAGITPSWNRIQRNFIINFGSSGLGTTGGVWNLDHDDGSAYYQDYHNFLVFAGTKNYLGDHKHFMGNVIIHPDAGLSSTPYCHQEASDWGLTQESKVSWGERWESNMCVMQSSAASPMAAPCNETALERTVPI